MTIFKTLNVDYLKIIPSYKCNRACFYCYNQYLHQTANEQTDKLFNTLYSFLETQKRQFNVEVLGGEPLQKDIINKTISILKIVSNSLLCKKRIISTAVGEIIVLKKVIDLLDFVYLSTDLSNSNKNKKIIKPTQLYNICSFVHNEGVDLSLAVVLYGDENESDLEKFVLIAHEIGINKICFSYIGFTKLSDLKILNYTRLFYSLFILKNTLSDKVFLGGDLLETLDLAVQNIKRDKICNCGETSIIIQPDGNISPSICIPFNSKCDYTVLEFVQMKDNRLTVLENSFCNKCELWPTCRGGCMGAALHLNGNHLAKDESFCNIIRSTWRLIKEDIRNIESNI